MSAQEEIPEKVLRFLDSCIDSIEQLRVLLLLHSDSKKTWTTAEISTELRSTESSIRRRLNDLYSRKVLTRHSDRPEHQDRHRFSLAEPQLLEVIDELAHQNQIRPYAIIEALYSRPNKTLRDFAAAFRFGGDES